MTLKQLKQKLTRAYLRGQEKVPADCVQYVWEYMKQYTTVVDNIIDNNSTWDRNYNGIHYRQGGKFYTKKEYKVIKEKQIGSLLSEHKELERLPMLVDTDTMTFKTYFKTNA